MEIAARITATYISEKRFLRVSNPEVRNPSEEQEKVALSSAVVQPAFRESNPNGMAYLVCTVRVPDRGLAHTLVQRCQQELLEIARTSGASLIPE
jgi:hypothetical protein